MREYAIQPLRIASTNEDGAELRLHERFRIGGNVRLHLDTPDGPAPRIGQIVDLSEGGCAVHVYKPVPSNAYGQIEVDIGGAALLLPINVRWTRQGQHRWKAGCRSDRTPDAKKAIIRDLLRRRRERFGPWGRLS